MGVDPRLLLDREVVQDPYAFYDDVRAESPAWQVGDSSVYLVTAYEHLVDAALRVGDFSSHLTSMLYRREDGLPGTLPVNFGPPTLGIADPPVHTSHKQLIFPRFVAKRMQLIEEELAAFAQTRIDKAREMGEFDFMEEIGGPVPIHAIAKLIGFRDANEQVLLQTAYDTSDVVGGTKTLDEVRTSQLRIEEISAWLQVLLDERDGENTEDLLDAVKAAINSGQFSMGEGLITMITLLSAGGESTGSLLGNSVRILAENPDVWAQLRENADLLPAFIEEAARIESPFRHHLRSVPNDTELAGVRIPAGSTVMLMWGAANRDPAKFAKPAELVLGRPREHVVFGRGIHQCVGSTLARMEARVVLSAMLRHDKFPTVSDNDKPEWQYNLQVRRHQRLPMSWQ